MKRGRDREKGGGREEGRWPGVDISWPSLVMSIFYHNTGPGQEGSSPTRPSRSSRPEQVQLLLLEKGVSKDGKFASEKMLYVHFICCISPLLNKH